jgi:transposase
MHVEPHVSVDELKRLARSEQDVRIAKRIQMVVLAVEGYTAPAIARSLGFSRRVCQSWVQRFNAAGLEGLRDKAGRGKPPLLTQQEQQRLKQRVDAGPTRRIESARSAAKTSSGSWNKNSAKSAR